MAVNVPLYVDGAHCPASDGATFEVRNPYSKEVVSISASASAADCKAAVDSASKAFKTWEHTPVSEKRRIMLRAAELLVTDKYKERITRLTTQETAATTLWAAGGAASGVNYILEAAALASQIKGESFPSVQPGGQVIVQRRALGVVLSIAPWNAPVVLSLRAVAVPLICGNTVVLKSSECSPASQAVVVDLFAEAGLPPGVLNYISASREDAPARTAEMIAHPAVRKVTFTGSDRVGRLIAAEAAKYLKPCVLELSGKAPAVVLADADINAAARAIVAGAMLHSGQICMSTERAIVERPAAEALLAELTRLVKGLRAGDPTTDNNAQLSCLFADSSAASFVSTLKQAKASGAQVLVGDGAVHGAIVQPHLVLNPPRDSKAWTQESFAPVVVVAVADDVAHAIELANDTDYSLTASLWTKDVSRALTVAAAIRAGAVAINGWTIHSEPGFGIQGLGGSTGYGRFDVPNFTDSRMIVVCPPGGKYPLVD